MKRKLNLAGAMLAITMIATSAVYAQPGLSTIPCEKPSLMQNNPNPFSKCTEVHCLLPDTFKTAVIKVYSKKGAEVQSSTVKILDEKSLMIDTAHLDKTYECTEGVVTICADKLPSGSYKYALVVDGKSSDKIDMVISRDEKK